MKTNISYKNSLGKPITEQQLSQIDRYIQVFQMNNKTIKEIEYRKNDMIYVTYFKSTDDTEQNLINIAMSEYPNKSFFIKENIHHGIYLISKKRWFSENGTYYPHTERYEVFDVQGNEIYYGKPFDYNPDEDEYKVQKYLTLNTESNIYQFIFNYNPETGLLIDITDMNTGFEESLKPLQFESMYYPQFFANNPYYLDDSLYPPLSKY